MDRLSSLGWEIVARYDVEVTFPGAAGIYSVLCEINKIFEYLLISNTISFIFFA